MTKLIRNDSPGALTLEQARELEIKRRKERQRQAEELAAQGRGEDTEIAHVARGELVIPAVMQTAELMEIIGRAAAAQGISLARLRVGSRRNRINPETGMAEFGEVGRPMPEDDPGASDVTIIQGPYPPGDPRYETDPEWAEEIDTIRKDVLEYPPPKANPILRGVKDLAEGVAERLLPESWRRKPELPKDDPHLNFPGGIR